MNAESKKIIANGLWKNNPAFVQILGLCPLLAVSANAINAVGLGLATIFVLTLSNILVSLSRRFILQEIRIPIFVLLIASAVSIVEIVMQAINYSLYQSLGIFLSLIVTNCVIIARAEAFAVKNNLKMATLDGFVMGSGFALGLLALGSIRELLSQGTLFNVQIFEMKQPIILAALPAGAFFCYALLIAARNFLVAKIGN